MKCCALPTLTSTSTGNGNGNDPPLRIPRKGILWSVTDVTVSLTSHSAGEACLLLLAAVVRCGAVVRCCVRELGTAELQNGWVLLVLGWCLLVCVCCSPFSFPHPQQDSTTCPVPLACAHGLSQLGGQFIPVPPFSSGTYSTPVANSLRSRQVGS
jgi:hypothetical protein